MRWKKKDCGISPNVGDNRARRGFLFFPKTIDGETRWLEYAYWVQTLVKRNIWGNGRRHFWDPVGFLTWEDSGWWIKTH
jgi:hypothetical protein